MAQVKLNEVESAVFGKDFVLTDLQDDLNRTWAETFSQKELDRKKALAIATTKASAVGVTFGEKDKADDIANYLHFLVVEQQSGNQWRIGDAAIALMERKGLRAAHVALATGFALGTINNWIRAALAFKASERDPNVPFAVYINATSGKNDPMKATDTMNALQEISAKKLSQAKAQELLKEKGLMGGRKEQSANPEKGKTRETELKPEGNGGGIPASQFMTDGMNGNVRDTDGKPVQYDSRLDYPVKLEPKDRLYWAKQFAHSVGFMIYNPKQYKLVKVANTTAQPTANTEKNGNGTQEKKEEVKEEVKELAAA